MEGNSRRRSLKNGNVKVFNALTDALIRSICGPSPGQFSSTIRDVRISTSVYELYVGLDVIYAFIIDAYTFNRFLHFMAILSDIF